MAAVEMPIVREIIPHRQHLLYFIQKLGCQVAAGFPLWMIGGADTYADIDIYCNDWITFYRACRYLGNQGKFSHETPHTHVFIVDDCAFQIVRPGARPFSDEELLRMADMSASACLLQWKQGHFHVLVLYPEDIQNRVCRVLVEHDWTWHRIQTYKDKGYQVISD